MYRFNYHRPTSLEEAEQRLDAGEDALFLAGGQTLIPTLNLRLASPSDLIDLAGIDGLSGIDVADEMVRVGAMTRHAEVAASADVQASLPVLADLAGQIGDAQVRNRGTLGGSVANSDPAADYPAAVVALDATVHTTRRTIPGAEFFLSLFETALQPGEIITAVEFRVPKRAAYQKFPNPASRYAVVGVLVAEFDDGVRVGITGAAACAYRSDDLETALNASLAPDAVDAVDIDYDRFNSDLHASAEYRANLVRVMARRAVEALLREG
ncbi:MAG: xanthine dehydrogenase family protein subunit M [Gammaproteobacteria bacterium]|nr:MAG: xanthine dehydrogenase family protein subunit M [Gammaproteobacteria bacterium]TDJ41401.1 MAG: xanthine dehydrogenase family protein subunit M [Gammaproteobacteria bacterium]